MWLLLLTLYLTSGLPTPPQLSVFSLSSCVPKLVGGWSLVEWQRTHWSPHCSLTWILGQSRQNIFFLRRALVERLFPCTLPRGRGCWPRGHLFSQALRLGECEGSAVKSPGAGQDSWDVFGAQLCEESSMTIKMRHVILLKYSYLETISLPK